MKIKLHGKTPPVPKHWSETYRLNPDAQSLLDQLLGSIPITHTEASLLASSALRIELPASQGQPMRTLVLTTTQFHTR